MGYFVHSGLSTLGEHELSSSEPQTGMWSVESGHRFYNPDLGRWCNRDPIGEKGGLNVYGFVLNDPVAFIDPFGTEVRSLGLCKVSIVDRKPPGGSAGWLQKEPTHGHDKVTFQLSELINPQPCDGGIKYDVREPVCRLRIWIDPVGLGRQSGVGNINVDRTVFDHEWLHASHAASHIEDLYKAHKALSRCVCSACDDERINLAAKYASYLFHREIHHSLQLECSDYAPSLAKPYCNALGDSSKALSDARAGVEEARRAFSACEASQQSSDP